MGFLLLKIVEKHNKFYSFKGKLILAIFRK